MTQLTIGKIYSFDVYAPNILTNEFQNVTMMANLDYETAKILRNVEATHKQIWNAISRPGVPDNPEAYSYIRVKTQSGAAVVLGFPWIREESITSIAADVMDVVIGEVTAADMPLVVQALASNGFNNVRTSMRETAPQPQ